MDEINLIDSHCHLIFDNFKDDIDDVASRWRSIGVKKLLHACVELSDIPKIKKIANLYSEIYYSVGLHPLDANQWDFKSKNIMKDAIGNDSRVVAIGEMGLDLFKNNDLEIQIAALLPQMQIAFEYDLPVIIHCREAAQELISICKDLKKNNCCPRGVLHCWSGTVTEMKEFLELGFYISFSGIVTFPKAKETHECAKLVPKDRYLIETDSPFLAPVPYRGKRNEPAFVESVAKAIAQIRLCDLELIASESTQNAEELFKFSLVK
tara:strand:- start:220 stop:1014 length:795 start_codon:yes stop_codon:yes gene_type:complete